MNVKHKKFVSAVAYVHDDEKDIEAFMGMLYNILDNNFEKYEIILVNDYSNDNSKEIIHNTASGLTGCMVSVINTGFYQGIEAAMLAGIDLAIGDFVVEFDEVSVDYDPNLVIQCYERSTQGFDIVSCGRARKKVTSVLFYSLYNRHSGTQYKLKSETFRILSRRAVNRVYSMCHNPVYRKALYRNCGLRTDYIKYDGNDSFRKHTLKNPHDTALTSLLLFTNIAYKATLGLAIMMMLATLGSIGYIVAIYLIGNPIEGYTTMMMLISGAFFGVFAILAVVIKYLSVLLRLTFHRQRYVLESIEKLTG